MKDILEFVLGMDKATIEHAIMHGELPFIIGKEKYRLRLPKPEEKAVAERAGKTLYVKLLHTEGYELEEQLLKTLKEKGKDIYALDEEFTKAEEKIKELNLRLAELGKGEETDDKKKRIEELKTSIANEIHKQQELSADRYTYTQYSIENQVRHHYTIILLSHCLEKKEKEEWKPVCKTVQDFDKLEEELKNTVMGFSGFIFSRDGALPNV